MNSIVFGRYDDEFTSETNQKCFETNVSEDISNHFKLSFYHVNKDKPPFEAYVPVSEFRSRCQPKTVLHKFSESKFLSLN